MAKIKINALIDEEEILNGFLKDKRTVNTETYRKLIVYTKYLRQKGWSEANIRNEIDDLMGEYYIGFVMDDWDDTLRKIVSRYTKKDRVEFKKAKNKIHINYEELEFIKSQEDSESLWVNCDRQILFTLSRYKFKRGDRMEQRGSVIHDILMKGLIDRNRGVTSTGIKLLYGDNIDIKEGIDLELNYENIENIIVTYLDWRQKEDYHYCKRCGKEIKKGKTSPIKYCPSCKKIKEVEKVIKSRRKTE